MLASHVPSTRAILRIVSFVITLWRIIPSRSTRKVTHGHSRPRRVTNGQAELLGVIFTPQKKHSDKRGQCDTTLSSKTTYDFTL